MQAKVTERERVEAKEEEKRATDEAPEVADGDDSAEAAEPAAEKKLKTQRPDQAGYKAFCQRGLRPSGKDNKVFGHVPGIEITRR